MPLVTAARGWTEPGTPPWPEGPTPWFPGVPHHGWLLPDDGSIGGCARHLTARETLPRMALGGPSLLVTASPSLPLAWADPVTSTCTSVFSSTKRAPA